MFTGAGKRWINKMSHKKQRMMMLGQGCQSPGRDIPAPSSAPNSTRDRQMSQNELQMLA